MRTTPWSSTFSIGGGFGCAPGSAGSYGRDSCLGWDVSGRGPLPDAGVSAGRDEDDEAVGVLPEPPPGDVPPPDGGRTPPADAVPAGPPIVPIGIIGMPATKPVEPPESLSGLGMASWASVEPSVLRGFGSAAVFVPSSPGVGREGVLPDAGSPPSGVREPPPDAESPPSGVRGPLPGVEEPPPPGVAVFPPPGGGAAAPVGVAVPPSAVLEPPSGAVPEGGGAELGVSLPGVEEPGGGVDEPSPGVDVLPPGVEVPSPGLEVLPPGVEVPSPGVDVPG
ncbi:hypothetical protein LUW74_29420 [Actinomadura madurae]|uniref:hypothetical protein n=1 Tax=Actinomadura madurae TaxID=1993 RepID=UPI00202731C9|nr:hypothetical protein [Actinomadura madurae]URN07042.1 hypothetical protein LUW74_29420 [Actinomadura madurae]